MNGWIKLVVNGFNFGKQNIAKEKQNQNKHEKFKNKSKQITKQNKKPKTKQNKNETNTIKNKESKNCDSKMASTTELPFKFPCYKCNVQLPGIPLSN